MWQHATIPMGHVAPHGASTSDYGKWLFRLMCSNEHKGSRPSRDNPKEINELNFHVLYVIVVHRFYLIIFMFSSLSIMLKGPR